MTGTSGNSDQKLPAPETALEKDLCDAFLYHNYAQVKKIVTSPDCPNHLKASALNMAVAVESKMMVRIIFESAKPELTPAQGMLLVIEAGKKQNADIAAYLCERNVALGIPRGDSYALVFNKFTDDKMPAVIDAMAAAAGADKQAALNSMLKTASEKKYAAMGGLIDRGAEMGEAATEILSKLTIGMTGAEFYKDKAAYLSLVEKCAAITPAGNLPDCFAGIAGMLSASGMQYPETAAIFLRHGADPFYGYRHMGIEKLPAAQGNIALRDMFAGFEQPYTKDQRDIFNAIFGGGYTLTDLKQEIDADGTTGLMLAARARMLPDVMQKLGAETLTSQDLLYKDKSGMSLMALAAMRNDAAVLLDAGYWRRTEPAILATLDKELTDDVKRWSDLPAFASRLDHAALKDQAVRFKLRPKL